MNYEIFLREALERRKYWVSEIVRISGNFGQDSTRVEAELEAEYEKNGVSSLLDHLRLCGAIPEAYGHDTSEEKLYSKYTDALLAIVFRQMGLKSLVLTERADAADVEVFADDYSFVADAKAFRLSRTAKNQKDFKVQAMDGWRHDKKYALLVAPLYQLPTSNSQIYQQAIVRDVCILSYSHAAVLLNAANEISNELAQEVLSEVFACVSQMNPAKSALDYWLSINRNFVAHEQLRSLWRVEKKANLESIAVAKHEGLSFWATEREKIMRLSHEEALKQLVSAYKIDSKISILSSIRDNRLLDVGVGELV